MSLRPLDHIEYKPDQSGQTNPLPTDSIEFIFKAFVRNRLSIGRTDGTIEQYEYAVRALAVFLEKSEGSTVISNLPYAVIEDFLIDYMKQGRAKATANKTYRSLRALFNWAYRRKLIQYNPFVDLQAPKATAAPKHGYANDEVKAMFDDVRDQMRESGREGFLAYRDHALMLVLYDTGLRATEICNMTVGCVDWATGLFEVKGKGGKTYRRHLGKVARIAVQNYLVRCKVRFVIGDEGPLWRGWTGVRMTRSGVFDVCQRRADRAGIKDGGAHKWRYTHAEVLTDENWPEELIMAEMGHDTLTVSRQYRARAINRRALAMHESESPADKIKDWAALV